MMKLPNGKTKSSYLPLLLYIHGYLQHQGSSVFVKLFYKHHQFKESEVVPNDIVPIFGLVPTYNAETTFTYAYPIRERYIFIGAITNSIHVTKILAQLSVLHNSIFSGVTKRKGVHYHRVSLSGELPKEGQNRSSVSRSLVLTPLLRGRMLSTELIRTMIMITLEGGYLDQDLTWIHQSMMKGGAEGDGLNVD